MCPPAAQPPEHCSPLLLGQFLALNGQLCPPSGTPSRPRSLRGQRQLLPLVPCPETQVCGDEDRPRSMQEVKISNARSGSGGNRVRRQHSYNAAAAKALGSSWDNMQRLQTSLLTAFSNSLDVFTAVWSEVTQLWYIRADLGSSLGAGGEEKAAEPVGACRAQTVTGNLQGLLLSKQLLAVSSGFLSWFTDLGNIRPVAHSLPLLCAPNSMHF